MVEHIQLLHLRRLQGSLQHSHRTHLESIVILIGLESCSTLTAGEGDRHSTLASPVNAFRIREFFLTELLVIHKDGQRAATHVLLGMRETEPEPGILFDVQRYGERGFFTLLGENTDDEIVLM